MTPEVNEVLSPEKSNAIALLQKSNDLTKLIIEEDDPNKVNDLTQLFKLNQQKRDIARVNRLSTLIELIDDEAITRFSENPSEFKNDELLNYMKTTSQIVSNATQGVNQQPQIQITNIKNEVQANIGGLDIDSRKRVLETVNKILNSLQNKNEADIIDNE